VTGYLLSHALRAGIREPDFWTMTEFNVSVAYAAHDEDLSRLAWRTAYYHRVQLTQFPKSEDAIFRKATSVAKRQDLNEQYAMAKLITKVMH